jgi:hypothetical protein
VSQSASFACGVLNGWERSNGAWIEIFEEFTHDQEV